MARKNIRSMIVYCAVWSALIGASFAVGGRFSFNVLRAARAELNSQQKKLAEAQRLMLSLPDPDRALEDIDKRFNEFRDAGLTKKQLPKLTQVLASTAAQKNVRVLGIRQRDDVKAEQLPEGVMKIHMEMIVQAPYRQLAEFMRALGEISVPFILDSFVIRAIEAGSAENAPARGEQSLVQASLTVSTYMIWEL